MCLSACVRGERRDVSRGAVNTHLRLNMFGNLIKCHFKKRKEEILTASDSGSNLMCRFGEKNISVRLIFVRVMHGLHHAVYQNRDIFWKHIHQEPSSGFLKIFAQHKQTSIGLTSRAQLSFPN